MAGATRVVCVDSVAKAMAGVYQSFDPDVVLTDFSMPGADGLELIREFINRPESGCASGLVGLGMLPPGSFSRTSPLAVMTPGGGVGDAMATGRKVRRSTRPGRSPPRSWCGHRRSCDRRCVTRVPFVGFLKSRLDLVLLLHREGGRRSEELGPNEDLGRKVQQNGRKFAQHGRDAAPFSAEFVPRHGRGSMRSPNHECLHFFNRFDRRRLAGNRRDRSEEIAVVAWQPFSHA